MSTAVQHPANVREFVRRLGERGRTAYAIRKQLEARGVSPVPSERTIMRWADPDYAEVERHRRRNFRAPGPRRNSAWEARLDRMKQLRAASLSHQAIASVMRVDCDLELTAEQVRHILNGSTSKATTRRLLWPETGGVRIGRPPKAVA